MKKMNGIYRYGCSARHWTVCLRTSLVGGVATLVLVEVDFYRTPALRLQPSRCVSRHVYDLPLHVGRALHQTPQKCRVFLVSAMFGLPHAMGCFELLCMNAAGQDAIGGGDTRRPRVHSKRIAAFADPVVGAQLRVLSCRTKMRSSLRLVSGTALLHDQNEERKNRCGRLLPGSPRAEPGLRLNVVLAIRLNHPLAFGDRMNLHRGSARSRKLPKIPLGLKRGGAAGRTMINLGGCGKYVSSIKKKKVETCRRRW